MGQGRNEKGKGGTIPRAPNHHGGAESLREAPKRPNNVTSAFFSTVHLLPKDLRFEHGVPNSKLAYCPGHHLALFRPWRGAQIKVQETVHEDFNFAKEFLRPPSKWRPWHVPCLPYPRYATDSS